MTGEEFFEIAGYFANPNRNTRIEIEARRTTINSYALSYRGATGTTFPFGSDSVTMLEDNADKWGREMRLYFTVTDESTIPGLISKSMTKGGRPGYDLWDQRLNSKDIIDELFQIGFVLGHPQDYIRIRGLIPADCLADFDKGYNAL